MYHLTVFKEKGTAERKEERKKTSEQKRRDLFQVESL